MKEKIKKLKSSKGFTLIELIVVIAVLGILVLLAAPKFLGHTADAKLVQAKADIKTYETVIASKLIEDPSFIENWDSVSKEDLEKYRNAKTLFTKDGVVKEDYTFNDSYIDIPEELFVKDVKSQLKGDFIMDVGGNVYYVDPNLKVGENSNKNNTVENKITKYGGVKNSNGDIEYPNGDKVHQDGSFTSSNGTKYEKDQIEIRSDEIIVLKDKSGVIVPNDGFIRAATTADFTLRTSFPKYYVYSGSDSKIYIPSDLKLGGNVVTDASYMFWRTSIEKVVLLENNITNMYGMFADSKGATLDLSAFNTSNVTNMAQMLQQTKASTIDVSSFDTTKVTNMNATFGYTEATKIIGLNNFNTSNVTAFTSMFNNSKVEVLDLSSFDTSKSSASNVGYMFSNSQAKVGYARTQEDADKLNASNDKPTGLTFVVGKP